MISFLSLVFLTLWLQVVGQIDTVPGSSQTSYYLDTTRDCNDARPREVGQSTVNVYGVSTDYQGTPVTSCTLTLSTENYREPYRFKIQYMAVSIQSAGVSFFIYDGEAGSRLKYGWTSTNPKPSNLDFDFTTGSQVTFKLTRGQLDTNYDIRLVVTPTPSEVTDCSYGSEYGCDDNSYSYRVLGTKEIAGIVGGGFALVALIVGLLIFFCYCRQRGVDRRWTEEKLGHVNTAASLHTLNGHVPKKETSANSTKAWTTAESSRSGFASIRRSPSLPRAKIARPPRYGDRDSMYDSNASLPVKRPLPPPQVGRNPRSERSSHSRFRDRDRYDDDWSDRSNSTDTKNFSERNFKPPTYRQAMRHDSESSADEHTFVQADESQQQTVFIERVMEPRVKKKKDDVPNQRAPPPPEDDMEYDSIEPKRNKKPLMVDKTVEHHSEEEETEESDEDNETDEEESESEAESESDDEASVASEKQDKPDAVYSKPKKTQDKTANNQTQDKEKQPPAQPVGFRPPNNNPQQFPPGAYPGAFVPPGVHQPQPRYGYPGQPPMQPYMPGQQPFVQGQGYPYQQGQPYPQGQMYPGGQPAPPQAKPAQSHPNSYHQANFTVPLQTQQPQQPSQQQPLHHNHGSRPRNNGKPDNQGSQKIPVYSYLVNRGYQPLDGRHSPVSTSTGGSNLSGDRNLQHEDSDFSANLGSGVELMKRK